MFEIENIEKDPVDERDIIAGFSSDKEFNYDLIPFVREIEYQGSIGSCVGHAGVSALELLTCKDGKKFNFSRLFAYYNVRMMDNRLDKEGAFLRTILKSIAKYGLPTEDQYPYNIKLQNEKPPSIIYKAAKNFRVSRYERVPLKKENIKGAIDEGFPVLFSMYLYSDFNSMCKKLDASYYKAKGESNGGHAMVIVGYDKDGVILENSWGRFWGDNGMCAISWRIFERDAKDAWIATEYTEDPNPFMPVVKDKTKIWDRWLNHAKWFFRKIFK